MNSLTILILQIMLHTMTLSINFVDLVGNNLYALIFPMLLHLIICVTSLVLIWTLEYVDK